MNKLQKKHGILFRCVWLTLMLCAGSTLASFDRAVKDYELGNYKTALHEFARLAQKGSANAMFNVGFMIENGKGVQKNPKLAIRWYIKAWERKNKNAAFNIALIYFHGKGVPQDYNKALEWYKKSAAMGNAAALVNIGQMYYFGKGVKKSKIQAYAWYSLAANRGRRKALRNRDIVAKRLTPLDINNAETLYRKLRVKYLDPFLK